MICYIEKEALNENITQHIIKKFNPQIIEINHYKDIFNRSHQDFNYQKNRNVLILAKKKENFLYKGSSFCNNRGYKNFYYSTQVLGCIYNCEYCYIGGMYPCGYPVIFVNEDDFLYEAEKLKNAYIAISYESDLLAFEGLYPFHKKWIDLAEKRPDLLIESRTKSANADKLPHNPPKNFLLGFSLSPVEINKFEKKAPNLEKRIKALKLVIKKGYNVEIAIDPVIKTENFKEIYKNFIAYLKKEIDLSNINIEIGAFRMNKDFLKNLRKTHISEVTWYPYEIKNNEARYKDEKEIIEYVKELIVDSQ
ncbi:SPL family radical SAM protein [Nautilia lithotrophica]